MTRAALSVMRGPRGVVDRDDDAAESPDRPIFQALHLRGVRAVGREGERLPPRPLSPAGPRLNAIRPPRAQHHGRARAERGRG